MQLRNSKVSRTTITLLLVLGSLLMLAKPVLSVTPAYDELQSEEKVRQLNGEPVVILSNLEDGVTGVTGHIFIAASPARVWAVLTDYNNHKNYIPKVIDSGLISDNGVEAVIFQKGKTRILFFQKEVYVKIKAWGEYPKLLHFQQITGDFKVYKGQWTLEEYRHGQGTLLSYQSEVQPDFFAPRFVVKFVQTHDFPAVLTAMKKHAESTDVSLPK